MSLFGCDLSASGSASASGSTAPAEGPPAPEYERTFDEFVDVPNQMTAQVVWAAEPIDNAVRLADEIAALRAELDIDPAAFSAMCTVAFKDGTIEIGAVTEYEDARAKIEATLAKIKQVGVDLQGVPGRIKVAGKNIGKLAMSTPKLALKTTKELSGELAVAVGDGGVQIEADIATAKELPNTVKNAATEAKNSLTELPAKAAQATKNLMAAMNGEAIEPMETTGDAAVEGEAEAEVAVATTDAAETATTDAAATTTTDAAATTTTTTDAGATAATTTTAAVPNVAVMPPPGSANQSTVAGLPPAAVTARIAKLQKIGKEAADRGDWLSAADAFEEAYVLAPDNLVLAYKTGDAAAKAKDCERARINLERFVQYGDQTLFAPELALANKTLGELKTFECPPRTPADEAALAGTLVKRAEELGKQEDWGGAATTYALAYQLTPEDHALAFQVAVASWNSRECADADTYFAYFLTVGDPKLHRTQLRETKRYQEESAAGMCPKWAVGEKETHARDLYAEAQALDLELDFKAAIGKYERAYYILPTNHALAFRIGDAAWKGQECEQAQAAFSTFTANVDATDPRHSADVKIAKGILARIDSAGCPNALWSSGGAKKPAASDTADVVPDPGGEVGGDERPPKSGGGGGGSVACSVTDQDAPAGGLAFGLLLLAAAIRRRED
ncbi:MYXO-CTERM sorting domain-containing protein [Enhygromyxa salina]|uniref:MYXO-CTERM sorting domain-containing protein n=1 Tax=Enhygromyxa salina TaxID=215803 RepID=UPI0011B1DE6C|nr:MYXO-CTERM sorting domain-containing protein [Enhygromyxa salina]